MLAKVIPSSASLLFFSSSVKRCIQMLQSFSTAGRGQLQVSEYSVLWRYCCSPSIEVHSSHSSPESWGTWENRSTALDLKKKKKKSISIDIKKYSSVLSEWALQQKRGSQVPQPCRGRGQWQGRWHCSGLRNSKSPKLLISNTARIWSDSTQWAGRPRKHVL